jgi:sugar phosphate isomerase/epimerase
VASITPDFAVQSYCFRNIKDNTAVAKAVREIGLNKIELCGVHCDFNKPETFASVIDIYRKAGVQIVSIGVEGMNGDEAAMTRRFDFVKAAGAKHISVNFSPNTFDAVHPVAQKLAEKYDVRCGIHNHGGYHWLGNSEMLRYVFPQVGDRIGLCMDTAWALAARQDPIKMVEEFGKRLWAVHLKDFVFHGPTGNHEDVIVGTGNLKLKEFIAALNAADFRGQAIMEYEGDPENPIPTLGKCVTAIRAAL